MKPLLFLDVDGPLNPYMLLKEKKTPDGYTRHRAFPLGGGTKGFELLLNHDHGRKLQELPYELVWATTWEKQAHEWIGCHLGLPELPVVEFGPSPARSDSRIHWKTDRLIEYAEGRPFVWVDDEVTSYDWSHIQGKHGPHGDIYRIDPKKGLTGSDFYLLNKKAGEVMAACERASE